MNDHPLIRRTQLLLPIVILVGMLALSLVGSGVAQATDKDSDGAISRQVGGCPGGQITNTTTTDTFCDIQAAIDDPDTLGGHTLSLSAGTYSGAGNQNINVNKEVIISGAGAGTDPTDSIVDAGGVVGFNILANNVTLTGLTVQNGTDAVRFSSPGGTIESTTLQNVWLINNASHGVNIINNTTVLDLDILDASQITGNIVGLGVDSTSSFDGIGISDTVFANDDYGVNIVNSGATTTIQNLTINNGSFFSNHTLAAVHFEEMIDGSILNSTFDSNRRGVDIFKSAGTGNISGININGNTFTDSTQSSISVFVNGIGLGSFTASGNTINQNVNVWSDTWGAIEILLQANQTHGNVTIDGNTINFSGTVAGENAAYGIRVAGASNDIDILNNLLRGNSIGGFGSTSVPATSGILIVTNDPTVGTMDDEGDININSNLEIVDFIQGISFFDAVADLYGGVPSDASVVIFNNNLVGNGPGDDGFGVRNGTGPDDGSVTATCNWWGDPAGPGPVGPSALGDRVTTNVFYQPWLIAPAPSGSCTGGQTGNLDVVKIVNWQNSTPQDDQVFDICVLGPFPSNSVNPCQIIGGPGFVMGTLSFPNLPAGDYTVYEVPPTANPPGARWEVIVSLGEGEFVTVSPSTTPTVTITNIYFPPDSGNLDVTKVVNWNGVTPDEAQTFEICVTGPSPSTDQQCLTYDFDGATMTFADLLAGDYTISETDPGVQWTTTIEPNPVTVVVGETASATVTNTHEPPPEPGSLVVTKIVNWGETPPIDTQTFTICITGPAPSTTQTCGDPVGSSGGDVSFLDLQAGSYAISENDPGPNWMTTISPNPVSVVAGQQATATVTNTYVPPVEPGSLVVTKIVNWGETPPIDTQTFTICIAGPAPSTAQTCGDPVGSSGGDVSFPDLQPGDYTISENDPGPNWTTTIEPLTVSVASNQQATATVTNTYVPPTGGGTCLIYAVQDEGPLDSQFFTVNLFTGEFANLGPLHPGVDIEGIDTHPVTGELYGAGGDRIEDGGPIFRIDRDTGELELLGYTGHGNQVGASFRPTDNSFWVMVSGVGIYVVDLSNPANNTEMLDLSDYNTPGGIAWNADGSLLYVTVDSPGADDLYVYNPADGSFSPVCLDALSIKSEGLEFQPDGTLTIGAHHQTNLAVFNFDIPTCTITETNIFPQVPYPDVESFTFELFGDCEPPQPEADVVIAKSGPDTAQLDTSLQYTLSVTNNGPDPANGVAVSDVLPDGLVLNEGSLPGYCVYTAETRTISCAIGDLNAGASVNISYMVTAAATGSHTNTATVSSESPSDPNLVNNTATHTITVTDEPPPTTTVTVEKVWLDADGQPTDVPADLDGFAIVVTTGGSSMTCTYDATSTLVCDPASLTLLVGGSYNVSEQGVPAGTTSSGLGDFTCNDANGCVHTVTNQLPGEEPDTTTVSVEKVWLDHKGHHTDVPDNLDGFAIVVTDGTNTMTCTYDATSTLVCDPASLSIALGGSYNVSEVGLPAGTTPSGLGDFICDSAEGCVHTVTNQLPKEPVDVEIPPECEGIEIDNIIFGTEHSDQDEDTIYGTEGNDLIFGLGGHDYIYGLGGDDCIFGGPGSDDIYGGDGNDRIFGGSGQDSVNGGDGDDYIEGNDDSDLLEGGNGNDVLYGNNGNDCIFGGDGNDLIYGGAGSDAPLVGNGGDDTIYGGPGHDQLYGDEYDGGHAGGQTDPAGEPGNDTLYGEGGSDYFDGGPGNDTIDGGDDSDNMFGGDGDDSITGGNGSDAFFGDAGFDTAHDFVLEDWLCENVEVGCGDEEPVDSDGDGIPDDEDVCPGFDDNLDTDGDGTPDGCDSTPNGDDDGDGVDNAADVCPGFDDNVDTDGDGTPDGCDSTPNGDDDGDGVDNAVDVCPGFDDNVDTDGDGTPDGCDSTPNGDDDGDGVDNAADVCPGFDDNVDTDGDGTPDGCDTTPNGEEQSEATRLPMPMDLPSYL